MVNRITLLLLSVYRLLDFYQFYYSGVRSTLLASTRIHVVITRYSVNITRPMSGTRFIIDFLEHRFDYLTTSTYDKNKVQTVYLMIRISRFCHILVGFFFLDFRFRKSSFRFVNPSSARRYGCTISE